jgi:peptide/nickel transport system permease protein
MWSYIAQRLILVLLVAFLVSILIFVCLNFLPGSPVDAILGPNAPPEQRQELIKAMNLDAPPVQRYLEWLSGIFRGDMGKSIHSREEVSTLIKQRFPATLELGLLSLVLSLSISLPVGIYSGIRRGSVGDVLGTAFAMAAVSMPVFWTGILLILFFSLKLGWFPASGYVPFVEDPLQNLKLMVLPAIAISTTSTAMVMRQTRSGILEVLSQDYVRTAWAKGLRERTVVLRHAFRNAMIPIMTVFGFQVAMIFAGAVLVETIFAIPGMGRLLVDAIYSRDFVVVQSVAFFVGVLVLLVNTAVDISYALIDPRIRLR